MDKNSKKKLDDDQHTSRGDLEQPHIVDQLPPYIIDRHSADSIDLHPHSIIDRHPLEIIDRHPSLEELPGYMIEIGPIEEIRKRVKRIHDPVRIMFPCDVFEAESPIPPNRSMKFSSYIEVLDDPLHAEASQRGLRFRSEVDTGPTKSVSNDINKSGSIDTTTSPSIDTTTSSSIDSGRISKQKEFDVCENIFDGVNTTRSDKFEGKKRRNWKKRKMIKDGPQLSLIPHLSDGVRKSRVRSRCLSKPFAKLRAILTAEIIDKREDKKIERHCSSNFD
ncbi:hypothetical protein IGI04_019189 [Brassica rapa subsp. trilocularis]|uniref:Uncharacterized protein n=1 Tax=Brassica rapa subsp. trilocularis TaxID=1813537 RepID=A0ABQ7MHH8_BRACM|nr:hypothetical protein IGI04_019189 [Brassica rapa subsp. trilocularis]